MSVVAKAKILAVNESRAVVEIDGKKRIVDVRSDAKIKKGDIVAVAFNAVIDRI